MSGIIDASAILAIMLDEQGSDVALEVVEGARVSAVNLSEVYRKLVDQGMPLADAIFVSGRFRMFPVPFDAEQAAEAARLRPLTRHMGFSFADRACLALAGLMRLPVYTADRDWAKIDLGLDIRLIR